MNILLSIDTSFMSPIDWPGEIVDNPAVADIWVVDPECPVTQRHLDKMPNLKVVATASTGTNHIDVGYSDVRVLSLLDNRSALDEIRASSEFTFLLILNALRRMDKSVQIAQWTRDADAMRGHELYGKLVGLIGHGRIGKNIENWCRAFGAGVYWYDPYDKSDLFQPGFQWLFGSCNVVVVCCTLSETTRGMIRKKHLATMKDGACLVNTARGEVIAESDLVEVAKARPDLTFCLDVLSREAEGEQHNSPLLNMENVCITPHVSGLTIESNEKAAQIVCSLLKDYVNEAP